LSDVLNESESGGTINLGQSPLDFQPSARDLAFREWLLRDVLADPAYKDHAAWVNSRLLVDGVEIPAGQVTGLTGGRVPAGSGALWFSDTAPTSWAILDGSTITDAQTLNPTLWDNVSSTWKSGANIVLPDMRGRMPCGKGTWSGVNSALGQNDGLAVGNRIPHHYHVLTGVAATDPWIGQGLNNATGGFDFTVPRYQGGTPSALGVGVSGYAAYYGDGRGQDAPAWITVNFIIKL
jgi:microcystin-dependent protein